MKIVDKESKTNLPRWFNGVSIILKNMRCGSLEIILPDNRNFIYQGIAKGPKGIIFVKNNDFFCPARFPVQGLLSFYGKILHPKIDFLLILVVNIFN